MLHDVQYEYCFISSTSVYNCIIILPLCITVLCILLFSCAYQQAADGITVGLVPTEHFELCNSTNTHMY